MASEMTAAGRLDTTHLFREIHEQPEALGRFLESARGGAASVARALRSREIRHVVVAARGTSDNAARYAGYLLPAENRLHVGLTSPSLFSLYGRPPRLDGALVLGISQSGRSPDIVAVLAEARRQGTATLAITNAPGSELASAAEFHIDLGVGPERSVAASKTYTAELAAVALLSAALAEDVERMRGSTGCRRWSGRSSSRRPSWTLSPRAGRTSSEPPCSPAATTWPPPSRSRSS